MYVLLSQQVKQASVSTNPVQSTRVTAVGLTDGLTGVRLPDSDQSIMRE